MSRLIVGAQVVLYLNGMPYAYVAEITPTITSPQKELRGIDTLLPFDTAPGQLTYNVSATIYRVRGSGGLEGQGFMPQWDKATRGKYFSALVMDRTNQEILFESQKSQIVAQTWKLARGIIMGQVQWIGISYKNDSETLFG